MTDTTRAILSSVSEVAQRQSGAFHRRQASAAGMTREAVRWQQRERQWRPVTKDVLVVAGSADTWHRRLWIAHLEAGPGSVLSHLSAAALLGIPGFGPGPAMVTICENRSRRLHQSVVHQTAWLPQNHIVLVGGLRCTSLARSIFDLAGLSSPKRRRRGLAFVHPQRVERGLDDALVRSGLRTEHLADVVATLGRRGRSGTALMRRLLDEREDGFVATESALEDLLRKVLAAHGLPQPERQRVLGGHLPVGRVDFVYLDARLIIEADSRKHHSSLLDRRNDRRRDIELVAGGWRVIRVAWSDLVQDPQWLTDRIRKTLANAAA